MELAVAGAVAFAGVAVEVGQQQPEQVELLEALQLGHGQGRLAWTRHQQQHPETVRKHSNVLS